MAICFLLIAVLYFLKEVPVQAAELMDSGTCGENLQWELDEEGVLIISGTGDMYNYYFDSYEEYDDGDFDEFDVPWADYEYNDMIQSVYIKEGVTSIGSGAFCGLDTLKEVSIPQGLQRIGYEAFYRSGTTEIRIPDSVKTIKQRAVLDCENLKKIIVDSNNENYASDESGVLFNKDKSILIVAPGGISGSYTIPDSVKNVSDYAFYGCAQVTGISLSDNISKLGKYAFGYCNEIAKIELPKSLVVIGDYAFCGSKALKTIVIPDSVVEVGIEAFIYCTGLTEVTLPSNLKSLEANVFYECTSLVSVTLPEQLKIIEMGAFRKSGLRKIVIPDSVTYIGESAFCDCTELRNITLSEVINQISPFMFCGCSNLTSVEIPQNVTTIGRAAFAHSGLETILVPENVEFMENSVFYGCVNLEYAYISTKIIYIPEYTFCGCSSFVGITMSPNVEMIGEWAFHNTNFAELSLDLFPIKEIGRGAFSNCLSLEKVTLPDTLVKISEEAFRYSPNLTEISSPAGVKGCAADSFSDNWEVTIIYGDAQYALLDNGLLSDELYGLLNTSRDFEYTIIGEEAIINQYVGTDTVVVVPEKIDGVYVTAIGEEVFANRDDIEYVTMFRGVKSIGNSAFASCVNLRMVNLSSELVDIGESAFENCNSLEYVELSLTLTEIGSRAFAETALKYITVPRGVEIINYGTFYGCKQLKGVYLEDGIVRIDDFAFGKTSLETVTIPYTVTGLASNVFFECNKLSIIYKFVRYFYSGGDLFELFNGENSDDYI